MPIANTGLVQLPSINFNYFVQLHYVLGTPSISHNLISIGSLCYDNNAYVEFFHGSFLVKDLQTKSLLFQDKLDGGLYKLSLPSTPFHGTQPHNRHAVFLSTFQDMSLWHRRLGHPSSHIVKFVLSLCGMKSKNNDVLPFCNHCQMAKSHKLLFSTSVSHVSSPFEIVCSDIIIQ